MLRLAYPELHADQRNAILKATALDSGYPLWQSSDGWQRINWAKALCARVTLDKHGDVAKVETADQVALAGPSVVNAQYIDAGNHPASDSLAGENSATGRAGSRHPPCRATTGVDQRSYRYCCNRDYRRNTDGSTQPRTSFSSNSSQSSVALLTAAVTLSSIALIGVPAATADEQQTTAEIEHGCQTIRNHQRGLCRQ